MGVADQFRARVDEAWDAFRAALDHADLEQPTSVGWRGKEMLAHIAFWMETVPPFVAGAFRGDPAAFQVTFPSGYVAGEGDWPAADVHNAREAAWARQQPTDAVVDRADRAYAQLRSFLTSVTDDEVVAHPDYFTEVHEHLETHRAEELQGA